LFAHEPVSFTFRSLDLPLAVRAAERYGEDCRQALLEADEVGQGVGPAQAIAVSPRESPYLGEEPRRRFDVGDAKVDALQLHEA